MTAGSSPRVSRAIATRAGAYRLSVTYGGDHVAGSPFALWVAPGDASNRTTASGAALSSASANASHRTTFIVHARDAHANALTRGGGTARAAVCSQRCSR